MKLPDVSRETFANLDGEMMSVTKREIADELGVSKRTIANYIGKLELETHVSRVGNTDFLDDFAAAAIADAIRKPRQPKIEKGGEEIEKHAARGLLVDSLMDQLHFERARNADLQTDLENERDRANRLEADSKAQLAEANARIAELAGKLAKLAERQQMIAATPFWRRWRMTVKLLGPGSDE